MRSPARWAVAALALVLAGCGGNATASGTAAERLVPLTPAIRAAYDGYWSAWLAANRDADPDLPGLAAHAADPHLEVLRAELTSARRAGHVVRGAVTHEVRGMDDYGTWYRVVDCVDLTGWIIYDRATGQPVPQAVDRPRQLGAMSLERVDGAWRVTHGQILGAC